MTITSEAVGAKTNPLIDDSTLPYGTMPFSKLAPADYEQGVLEGIKLHNQEIDAIVNQRSAPTFENTIAALDRSGKVLNRSLLALSNIETASGDTLMQNIMAKITPALSEHETSIMLNERLWDRIKQVYDSQDKDTSLTPEQKRLIHKTYENFATNGAGLKGEDREKYRRLSAELSDLTLRYGQNISNGMKE